METSAVIAALAALAQETRLEVFRHLVQTGAAGLPAGQIGERLALPAATLSFHLNQLRQAGLITVRREGRSLIYAADYGVMNSVLAHLMQNCCQGQAPCAIPFCLPQPPPGATQMIAKPFNVLFLCTGNSARSILAEALIDHWSGGRFKGFSAGSDPKGVVHPLALALLAEQGLRTEAMRSKSWLEFAAPNAPQMDFVFTVCDAAAAEPCPVWPGHPVTAHWGVPDPAAATGSDMDKMLAFRDAFKILDRRIQLFTALPDDKLKNTAIQREVDAIGRDETTDRDRNVT